MYQPNHPIPKLSRVRPLPLTLLWAWTGAMLSLSHLAMAPLPGQATEITIPADAPVAAPQPVSPPPQKPAAAPKPKQSVVNRPAQKPVIRSTPPSAIKPARKVAPASAPKPITKTAPQVPASAPSIPAQPQSISSPSAPSSSTASQKPRANPVLPARPSLSIPAAPQSGGTVASPSPTTPANRTTETVTPQGPDRRYYQGPQTGADVSSPRNQIVIPAQKRNLKPHQEYLPPTEVTISTQDCQAAFSRKERQNFNPCGTPRSQTARQQAPANQPVVSQPRVSPAASYQRQNPQAAWSVQAPYSAAPYRLPTSATSAPHYLTPAHAGQVAVAPGITAAPATPAFPATPYAAPNRVQPYQGANPLKWLTVNNRLMRFPLTIPIQITSVFGWREHPIHGGQKFHEGVDFAAPQGTPVVAAYSGEVLIAGDQGGYGLSVLISHDQGQHATRYAHLSELFVAPGMPVEQGAVIGLVGSTGYSTGPHLHFEALQNTAEGLVVVDPTERLHVALVSLVQALHLAKQAEQEKIAQGDSEAAGDLEAGGWAAAYSHQFKLIE